MDVEAIGCDLLSISGHKLYAPKGIGALYVRRGVRLKSQNLGGRQERGFRGGTEPVPNIVAFGKACELAMEGLMNSPGHKANILSPQFGKIGIGAMQGGIYGLMFTQEFTD